MARVSFRGKICIFVVTVLISLADLAESQKTCTKVSACSCTFGDGTGIDLSPLAKSDGTAAYQDVPTSTPGSTDVFSWNPCTPFSEESCSGIAVVQIRQNIPQKICFSLGTQDSADFLIGDLGLLTLQYSADTVDSEGVNTLRTTNLILTCDENNEGFAVNGEDISLPIFSMELTSKHACPKAVISGGSAGGLSVGSVLVIIFCSVLVLYLIGGLAFQAGVRKARGSEMIPNISFWKSVPVLAKDGVMFVVTRGKRTSYQNV